MPAEMKILGTLFRLLCALVVLLAIGVYLDGPLQASLIEYGESFNPGLLQSLTVLDGWFAIGAGALLLLALCCGMKLGWNLLYSLATIAFFTEVAIIALGPDMALPAAARGLGWEQPLRELATSYPVPTLLIPALCIIGCLCSTAPFRIAWTSLYSCALCYGCAELLACGVQQWQAMPEPFMPRALAMIQLFPWILLALPAVFFLQYCLFMALFETFMPHGRKGKKKGKDKKDEKREEMEEKKEDKGEEKSDKLPAAAATVNVAAKPVVLKRPVVHKKKPVSPAPAEEKPEEETKPADEPAPSKPEKGDDAPAEETADAQPESKEEAAPASPEAKEEAAPAAEKKEEAPKAEDAPAAPEKEEKPAAAAE